MIDEGGDTIIMGRINNLIHRVNAYKSSKTQKLSFYSVSDEQVKDEIERNTVYHYCKIDNIEAYNCFCHNNKKKVDEEHIKRLQRGSSYYLLMQENTVVTHGWLAYKEIFWIGETDSLIDMKNSDVAILYDFETNENYRGQGLYGRLLHYMVNEFKEAKKFLIYAKIENESSKRGIIKAGFYEEGEFSQKNFSYRKFLEKNGYIYLGKRYIFCGLRYATVEDVMI